MSEAVGERTPFLASPRPWVFLWLVAYLTARGVLEQEAWATWIRLTAALLPVPIGALALAAIVRNARALDELERRIQLEALATAFLLAIILLMTLGLLQRVITLKFGDWSYLHVWAMLPMLYLIGLITARARYS